MYNPDDNYQEVQNVDKGGVTLLNTIVNREQVSISLEGVDENAYAQVGQTLNRLLGDADEKNRTAIKTAFLEALDACPNANASDLWHHVVYRQYCEIVPFHRKQNPSQSWVRASGDALELVLQDLYGPILAASGIEILALISRAEKSEALAQMGLTEAVGSSKLDVALYVRNGNQRTIFGGVHVKASLAERVSDDVPASMAMIGRGLWSPLWTLDVKSFPPPHGDLVNRGELGSPDCPSDKRRYIEEHGSFDNCYTANSRSNPSLEATQSGKTIIGINLAAQPDRFANDAIVRGKGYRTRTATNLPAHYS